MIHLEALREANRARIPRFKNKLGDRVHNDDGSDWSLEQWFSAMMGELGETVEADHIHHHTVGVSQNATRKNLAKELADVVIYLDILAYQWRTTLHRTIPTKLPFERALKQFIHVAGNYANRVKKMRRREPGFSADEILEMVSAELAFMLQVLESMADSRGIDLGMAVEEKFNEVSHRVNVGVFLKGDSVEILPESDPGPRSVKIPLIDLREESTEDGRWIELVDEIVGDQGRWHTWYTRVIRHPDHGLLSYDFGRAGGDGEHEWGDAGTSWGDDQVVTCTRVRQIRETVERVRYEPIGTDPVPTLAPTPAPIPDDGIPF